MLYLLLQHLLQSNAKKADFVSFTLEFSRFLPRTEELVRNFFRLFSKIFF